MTQIFQVNSKDIFTCSLKSCFRVVPSLAAVKLIVGLFLLLHSHSKIHKPMKMFEYLLSKLCYLFWCSGNMSRLYSFIA